MRYLLTTILLLVHLNGSMFLPRLPEREMPGTIGHASCEVNSVLAWLDEVVLEHLSETPEDQEEESIEQLETPVSADYSHHSDDARHHLQAFGIPLPQGWAQHKGMLQDVHFEINTPPPEA